MHPVSIYEPGRVFSSTEGSQLIDWTNRAIEAGVSVLLVDLRKTFFMDSSGLGALVVASRNARQYHRKFALCSLNGQAHMLLELAQIGSVFEIYLDRDDFYQQLPEAHSLSSLSKVCSKG